jgi:hypothetical protein
MSRRLVVLTLVKSAFSNFVSGCKRNPLTPCREVRFALSGEWPSRGVVGICETRLEVDLKLRPLRACSFKNVL